MNPFLNTWKSLANQKKLSRYDMAFYCISKAFKLDGNALTNAKILLLKSFTPVTKETKLKNGRYPNDTLLNAVGYLRLRLEYERPVDNWICRNVIHPELLATIPEDELAKFRELIQGVEDELLKPKEEVVA